MRLQAAQGLPISCGARQEVRAEIDLGAVDTKEASILINGKTFSLSQQP